MMLLQVLYGYLNQSQKKRKNKLRCSICDRSDTRFIYNNWHCHSCEDVIRQAVGDLYEEDIVNIFESDDSNSYDLSVDTNDYTSCLEED